MSAHLEVRPFKTSVGIIGPAEDAVFKTGVGIIGASEDAVFETKKAQDEKSAP